MPRGKNGRATTATIVVLVVVVVVVVAVVVVAAAAVFVFVFFKTVQCGSRDAVGLEGTRADN